jgi:hypothetical protein
MPKASPQSIANARRWNASGDAELARRRLRGMRSAKTLGKSGSRHHRAIPRYAERSASLRGRGSAPARGLGACACGSSRTSTRWIVPANAPPLRIVVTHRRVGVESDVERVGQLRELRDRARDPAATDLASVELDREESARVRAPVRREAPGQLRAAGGERLARLDAGLVAGKLRRCHHGDGSPVLHEEAPAPEAAPRARRLRRRGSTSTRGRP